MNIENTIQANRNDNHFHSDQISGQNSGMKLALPILDGKKKKLKHKVLRFFQKNYSQTNTFSGPVQLDFNDLDDKSERSWVWFFEDVLFTSYFI